MALISLRQLLDHAAEHGYGVPAFNVNNLEQMRAIMQAAEATDSPVIVQASAGARKYARPQFLKYLMAAALEQYPDIPVCIHQDHGTDPDICQRSIQLGMSSVMMDGSLMADGKTPASYEYNVDVTRRTVAFALACGVSVEGEIGCLGSLETGEAGEEDGVEMTCCNRDSKRCSRLLSKEGRLRRERADEIENGLAARTLLIMRIALFCTFSRDVMILLGRRMKREEQNSRWQRI